MKPSFALNLTDDGITLLHRSARGWLDVGSVAFDNPDLPAALDYLRSTALGLSPTGISAKVVIPNSQIRYLQVDAPGPDAETRRAQIAAALDGRTPYSVDELAFDWSGTGPTVTVAVVARETLAEAEAFAAEHRFNPVSFVALPPGDFDKEPFFGTSELAGRLLSAGERIEPDTDTLTIISRDLGFAEPDSHDVLPEPEPAPEPVVEVLEEPAPIQIDEPAPTEYHAPEPVRAAEPDPVPEPKPEVPPLPEPEPEPIVVAQPEPEPTIAAQPEAAPPFEPEPVPEPVRVAEPERMPAPEPQPWPVTVPIPDPPQPSVTAARSLDEDEAPMAVDVPQEDGPEESPPATLPPKPSVLSTAMDDLPPVPPAAAMMAFASRRNADIPAGSRPLGGASDAATGPVSPAADMAAARPSGAPTVPRPTGAKPVVDRPASARPAPKFSYDDPVPPPPRLPGDPPVSAASMMGKAGKGLRNLGTLVTAPTIPGTRKKKAGMNGAAPTAPAPAPAVAAKPAPVTIPLAADAAPSAAASLGSKAAATLAPRPAAANRTQDAMGKGLGSRALPQRGKPRYLGLILTGVLLLLLALVAAWSSFYLTRSDPEPAADVQLSAADPVTEAEAGIDPEALADGQVPEPEEEMLADQQDPADQPTAVDEVVAEATAEPVPVAPEVAKTAAMVAEPAPVAAEPAPETAVQDQAATAVEPGATGQDEIFLAGMDTPPALNDPLVLPPPTATGDTPPAAQMPPPPFGTVYQFDENGLIRPTPEGIMTPDGVRLVAGPPQIVPPKRPASIEAAAPAAAAAIAAPGTEPAVAENAANASLTPAETFAADPALSDARPRVRPEGLAPAAAASPDDDASLAPAQDSRFSSLRPRERPQTILAAGEAARRASEAASLAAQAAADEAVLAANSAANISPMAVSVSRVPAPRPRDLSRAVEAAVAAATRQPETRRPVEPEAEPEVEQAAAPRTNRTAKVEEEADEEPEVAQRAAPRIPTKANVAKQATFVNAINLSKVNLIGVYGTQSKRYALVRQANGRYKKVRVGDSVDGGKVKAITASEVRYQKGGRMLTLAMPKG